LYLISWNGGIQEENNFYAVYVVKTSACIYSMFSLPSLCLGIDEESISEVPVRQDKLPIMVEC
jgi:hypothetical protein